MMRLLSFVLSCFLLWPFQTFSQEESDMVSKRPKNAIAENNLKVALGLDRGAVNMGAEYERRADNSGYSGYFLLATEKPSIEKHQMMIFGGGVPIYIFDNRAKMVSVTPGFGLNMMKISGTTEIALGAQLKLAASIRLSASLRAGLEHLILTNWINEKALGDLSLTQMIFTFSL
jgi:hypothetical protein